MSRPRPHPCPHPLSQGPIPSRSLLASLRRWKEVGLGGTNTHQFRRIECRYESHRMCTFARFALPCGEGRYANFSWFFFFLVGVLLWRCSSSRCVLVLAVALIFFSSISSCEGGLVVACGTVYVCRTVFDEEANCLYVFVQLFFFFFFFFFLRSRLRSLHCRLVNLLFLCKFFLWDSVQGVISKAMARLLLLPFCTCVLPWACVDR